MVDKIENKSKILTYLLGLYFLASPLDYILPHFGDATILTAIGLVISAFTLFFAFGSESAKMTADQVCILFLALLMIISNLWAQDNERSYSYTFSFAATAIMYFLLFFFKFTKQEIDLFEIASIVGGALFVVYAFTEVDMAGVNAGYRLHLKSVGNEEYFADPNGLAARLMMPLLFTIKRFLEKGIIYLKVIYGVLLALMVYVIFLTGSRAAVITLSALVLVIVLSLGRKRLSQVVFFCFVAFIIIMLVPDLLPSHIYDRIFSFESYQDVTTREGDRIDVWGKTIFNVFPQSPIWGHGAGNASIVLEEYYGQVKSVHNTWFSMLGDLGLMGFVLWIAIPLGKLKKAVSLRKKNVYPLAVLIGVLVMAFTLDAMMEKYLWNGFLYVHLISTMYKPQEDNVNQLN